VIDMTFVAQLDLSQRHRDYLDRLLERSSATLASFEQFIQWH
jgi:hypothetical protein